VKWRSALLISLAVTLAATAVLGLLTGRHVSALFLLLPLGFLIRSKPQPPAAPRGNEPIEPK